MFDIDFAKIVSLASINAAAFVADAAGWVANADNFTGWLLKAIQAAVGIATFVYIRKKTKKLEK